MCWHSLGGKAAPVAPVVPSADPQDDPMTVISLHTKNAFNSIDRLFHGHSLAQQVYRLRDLSLGRGGMKKKAEFSFHAPMLIQYFLF